jgi:hypothetical protein
VLIKNEKDVLICDEHNQLFRSIVEKEELLRESESQAMHLKHNIANFEKHKKVKDMHSKDQNKM